MHWGVSDNRVTLVLGVPIIRIIVLLGSIRGTPTLGNAHTKNKGTLVLGWLP